MKDLDKLSSILDEHIVKGLATRPKTKVEAIEQDLMKALSFDPFSPVQVTPESQYYNPYMQHPSGGYMPYPDTYWAEQAETVNYGGQTFTRPRSAGGYETVREFYSIVNDRDESNPRAIHPLFQGRIMPVLESQSRFSQFRKSHLDFIFKGKPVPVGTVHVGPDGNKYKKMAEGKWVPVAGLEHRKFSKWVQHPDPKNQAHAARELEGTASKRLAIEEAIKEKTRHQATIDEAKNQAVRAAAEHTHKMVSHLYDGKPPKELDQAHREHVKMHGGDEGSRGGTRKLMHQLSANMKPKHHAVEVHFTHNGQEYKHRFPQVESQSHGEAIERVTQLMKERLPGHTLSRIHAETPKEQGSETPAKKPAPKGEANA